MKPTDRRIVALNFAAMAQHGIVLMIVGPMVPQLMQSFGIGESMVGFLLGMGSMGFVVGPLFAGAIIDRVNVRAALGVGFAVEAVVLVLFGLSPVFALAVIANFTLHLGASFVETSANVMPALTTQRRPAHAVMNLVHMFFSIGAFVGPFLIGLYLEATGRWRPIMFFAVAPTAVLLVWTLAVRFPRRRTPAGAGGGGPSDAGGRLPAGGGILTVLRSPHVLWGALTLLLYVGAEVGVSSWVVYYLQRQLGLSTAVSAAGLSLLWIFIMIGRYANSLLGNRLSSRLLVSVSGIAGALGVMVFLQIRTPVPAFAVLAWIGLCLSGVYPNVMAELNNRDPQRLGTATAAMAIGGALGAGFFQWFVGFIAETQTLSAAFVVPALLQLLLVVTFGMALRRPAVPTAPPGSAPQTAR